MENAIDPFILARIQFAANITFHILFPTITIALGWVLLFFKLRFSATGNEIWMSAYRFWVKICALSFGMGVVSGITMSFQFGTNWPGFMEAVGNVAGPLLGYEILTASYDVEHHRVQEAVQELVALYTSADRADDLATWKAKLVDN